MEKQINNTHQLKPLILESTAEAVVVCPQCHSLNWDDQTCDDCGHTLTDDFFKSFYKLKQNYLEALPSRQRSFPLLENKKTKEAKIYCLLLKKRFLSLVKKINHHEHKNEYYLAECQFIILELLDFNEDVSSLQDDVMTIGNGEYKFSVLEMMSKAQASHNLGHLKWPNYRLWGLIRIKFVIALVLMAIALNLLIDQSLRFI